MDKQATLLILFLVFAGAIFIQYTLVSNQSSSISSIEFFKGKKKKSKSSSKGKKKSKSSSKGKKKSKSSSKGKKKSKSSSKSKAGTTSSKGDKKTSTSASPAALAASTSAAALAAGSSPATLASRGAKAAAAPGGYVNCPVGYTCTPTASSPLSFSEVVGSLISPSLPDSRDMTDKLHASVDKSYKGKTPSGCPSDLTNNAIASRQMNMPNDCDTNSYIKKDSIPCYGCSL